MANPLVELQKEGQSVWYDNIRRGLISSGELKRLIDEDGVLGVTSNPAIFEKAIGGGNRIQFEIEGDDDGVGRVRLVHADDRIGARLCVQARLVNIDQLVIVRTGLAVAAV